MVKFSVEYVISVLSEAHHGKAGSHGIVASQEMT